MNTKNVVKYLCHIRYVLVLTVTVIINLSFLVYEWYVLFVVYVENTFGLGRPETPV